MNTYWGLGFAINLNGVIALTTSEIFISELCIFFSLCSTKRIFTIVLASPSDERCKILIGIERPK